MENRKLVILTCADSYFGQGPKVWDSMDVAKMADLFVNHGYFVDVMSYEEAALNIKLIRNSIVVYSSTQKPGYKDFLEDVLWGLTALGNVLIPPFDFFRAHENKGYQEILRQIKGVETIRGRYFSNVKNALISNLQFPLVYKDTSGAKSVGVSLVRSREELKRKTSKYEKLSLYWEIHRFLKKYIFRNRTGAKWYEHLRPCHRFVLQDFIANLNGDFKVLILGDKYYVLRRAVRDGDFRASGSGKLYFVEADKELLNFCRNIFIRLDCPFISLDVCETPEGYGLIEFQGVHFGPYTLIKSPFHYTREDGQWKKREKISILEEEIVASILIYLKSRLASE